MSDILLLDTHALLWWAEGIEVAAVARRRIDHASKDGQVYVSPLSAWEIAMAVARDRVHLVMPPLQWYRTVLSATGFREAQLSAEIMTAAEQLPPGLHRDPVDRFLVSTARHLGARLVTRDRKIVDYSAMGHVHTLPC